MEANEMITGFEFGCVFYANRMCNLDGDFCAEGPGCHYQRHPNEGEQLKKLLRANREGRVKILPEAENYTCGQCDHFQRKPGTQRGTCAVREQYKDRYGRIEKERGRFTPAQSRRACKQYKQRKAVKL